MFIAAVSMLTGNCNHDLLMIFLHSFLPMLESEHHGSASAYASMTDCCIAFGAAGRFQKWLDMPKICSVLSAALWFGVHAMHTVMPSMQICNKQVICNKL